MALTSNNDCKGVGLMEVLIGVVVLAFAILAMVQGLRIFLRATDDTTVRSSVSEIKNGIRREMFDILRAYFGNAWNRQPICNTNPQVTPFVPRLTAVLPSGIAIAHVSPQIASHIRTDFATVPFMSTLEPVLQRCSAAPDTTRSPYDYFQNQAGIYFCLRLTAGPNLVAASRPFLAYQPVIGEFYFTNFHALHGREVRCSELPGLLGGGQRGPIVSILYYTLHWGIADQQRRNTYYSHSGFITMGNKP